LWYLQHCSFAEYCLGYLWYFVFPHELKGGSGGPTWSWGAAGPQERGSWQGMDLVVLGGAVAGWAQNGGDPGGAWIRSPAPSWGLAGPKGWGAWQSRAVALRAYGAGTWWFGCSFSRSWCGEFFHNLGVQSAEVSALPGALPQPSVSPASQQGP
jgi:hypothetical protein